MSEPPEFHCLACGEEDHEWREALLNTRGVSFLGWSAWNRAATCLICRRCRHVHWFAQDVLGPEDAVDRPFGHNENAGCVACGNDRCYSRSALLNTRLASAFRLDWLDRSANALVCKQCGHMHWHAGGEDHMLPPRAEGAATGCRSCGSENASTRKALLNTRPLSFVGWQWLDGGARVLTCEDCRSISWYADRVR